MLKEYYKIEQTLNHLTGHRTGTMEGTTNNGETRIDFRGNHVHYMEGDVCRICHKTHEAIIRGIKF